MQLVRGVHFFIRSANSRRAKSQTTWLSARSLRFTLREDKKSGTPLDMLKSVRRGDFYVLFPFLQVVVSGCSTFEALYPRARRVQQFRTAVLLENGVQHFENAVPRKELCPNWVHLRTDFAISSVGQCSVQYGFGEFDTSVSAGVVSRRRGSKVSQNCAVSAGGPFFHTLRELASS